MTVNDRQAVQGKTWRELLQAANYPRDILAVARDYLATWSAEELGALPSGCQPPLHLQEPDDVVLYAFTLSQARLAGDENEPLSRMWRFFMEATQRVGVVMSRGRERRAANAATGPSSA